jgi:hypothetical protein
MDLTTVPALEGAALALRLEIVDYFASARSELRQLEAFALRGVEEVAALIDIARTSNRANLWLHLAEVRLASARTQFTLSRETLEKFGGIRDVG